MAGRMSVSAAVRYHDEIASSWDKRYRRGAFARRAAYFRDCILPLAPETGDWLDVGCGSGYFSRLLARHGLTVVGYDGSEAMVDEARSAARDADLSDSIEFHLVPTVESIPQPDASVDGCLCLNVLEYLSRPFDCLDEMVRVLKPGGLLVLSVPHAQSPVRAIQALRHSLQAGHGRSGSSYVGLSTFTVTAPELRHQLEKRSLDVLLLSGFDGFIPEALLRVLAPSLLYAVGRKATAVKA
jgi:2-polyprenyl-6-hydroxyphenyl methylase/3-demethylubiquinone-9 3-methyltransferase